MKTYIGTKVINAKPMTNHQFEVNKTPSDQVVNTDFKTPLTEGYKVVYEDGYESWSPKNVFECCYRELSSKEFFLIDESQFRTKAS